MLLNEDEKIIQSFKDNTLNRNELVFAMANQLNSINGNRVISLEGSWGTGKTFLLKKLKYFIMMHGKTITQSFHYCRLYMKLLMNVDIMRRRKK